MIKTLSKYFWRALALVVFIVVVVFSLLNMKPVTVNVFIGHFHLPLALMLLSFFVLGGVVVAILLTVFRLTKIRTKK